MQNNINVNVGGFQKAQYTYKTVVLKGSIPFDVQIGDPNTKYVIKYNFDLEGKTITIPEGCLLEFDGGAISNGTLVGQDTFLIYNQQLSDVISDIDLEGTFIHKHNISADDEDIEEVNNVIKLKDREPASETNPDGGMGRIILRKDKSFAEQITQENTIYEIRYDFDLEDTEVTIPANCVLQFDGGSLSNGTIVGQNTSVNAALVRVFDADVIIAGNWNVAEAYPEWFENRDLQHALDSFPTIKLIGRNYSGNSILMNAGNSIISDHCATLTLTSNNTDEHCLWFGYNCRLSNLNIRIDKDADGIVIDSEYMAKSWVNRKFRTALWYSSRGAYRLMIDNCVITGIYSEESGDTKKINCALTISANGCRSGNKTIDGTYIGNGYSCGITGLIFNDLKFDGNFKENLNINNTTADTATVDGWITDITFKNCLFNYAHENNIVISQDNKVYSGTIPPTGILFDGCTVQHNENQQYFCKMLAASAVRFVNTETWDWDWVEHYPIPPFYIDPRTSKRIELHIGQQVERTKWVDYPLFSGGVYREADLKEKKCPYKISMLDYAGFKGVFKDILLLPNQTNYNNLDICLIPDGEYVIDNAETLRKLNIPCTVFTSGTVTLVTEKDNSKKLVFEGILDEINRNYQCIIKVGEFNGSLRKWSYEYESKKDYICNELTIIGNSVSGTKDKLYLTVTDTTIVSDVQVSFTIDGTTSQSRSIDVTGTKDVTITIPSGTFIVSVKDKNKVSKLLFDSNRDAIITYTQGLCNMGSLTNFAINNYSTFALNVRCMENTSLVHFYHKANILYGDISTLSFVGIQHFEVTDGTYIYGEISNITSETIDTLKIPYGKFSVNIENITLKNATNVNLQGNKSVTGSLNTFASNMVNAGRTSGECAVYFSNTSVIRTDGGSIPSSGGLKIKFSTSYTGGYTITNL